MSTATAQDLYRVCVKIYAPEPAGIGTDAEAYVPIFHEWIRERALDLVLFDVADYAHVPDGPGIMLVTHEVAFALDRSDGRFGLLGQRRTPLDGNAADAVEATLRHTIAVAEKLASDSRLAGKLAFELSTIRVEANDRLRAPNSDEGFAAFQPVARAGLARVLGSEVRPGTWVDNDRRDRLAIEFTVSRVAEITGNTAA
jgi:hypothetical protein